MRRNEPPAGCKEIMPNVFTHPRLTELDSRLHFSWNDDHWVFYTKRFKVGEVVENGIVLINQQTPEYYVALMWIPKDRGELNIEKAYESLRQIDVQSGRGTKWQNYVALCVARNAIVEQKRKEEREAAHRRIEERVEATMTEMTKPQKFNELTTPVTADLAR